MQALADYEAGCASISAAELERLAAVLGMPTEFFLHDEPLLDWLGAWQFLQLLGAIPAPARDDVLQLLVEIATDAAVSNPRRN